MGNEFSVVQRDADIRIVAMKAVDREDARPLLERVVGKGPGKMSVDRYKRVIESPEFEDAIWEASFRWVMVPEIPNVLGGLSRKAATGDPSAVRLYLEVIGKLKGGEGDKHLHLHYMKGEEMEEYASELMDEIKQLTG